MFGDSSSTQVMLSEIAKDIQKQSEESIMQQLNWFISRGIISIVSGEMRLVPDVINPNKVQISQNIELKLKDHEYIEGLEKENAELKKQIENFETQINKMLAAVGR